jgi:hypothetical protein
MMQTQMPAAVALPIFDEREPCCPCGFAHASLHSLIRREHRNLIAAEAAMHPMAADMAVGVERRVANLQRHLEGRCA